MWYKSDYFALIRKIIDEFAISYWMYAIYLNSTYTYIRHHCYGTQQKIPTIYSKLFLNFYGYLVHFMLPMLGQQLARDSLAVSRDCHNQTHFEWNSLAATFRCYGHDDVTLTTLAISEMQVEFRLLTWRIKRKRVRRFMIFDAVH